MRYYVKRFITISLMLLVIGSLTAGEAFAQKKRAQTSMKFLSTSMFAQSSGMGDAVTSMEGNSSSLFSNPASMAWQQSTMDISLGHVLWIADIQYNAAAISFRPAGGRYGVIGLSATYVDYGEFTETIFATNERGYEVLGNFGPYAYAVGLGYARALSEQFSVGANIRYAYQFLVKGATSIDEGGGLTKTQFDADTYSIDFGVFYKTGFESLNFAMVLRNFSPEINYGFDTQDSELPLTFKIGLSMDLFDLTNLLNVTDVEKSNHALLFSVDANRPRDFDEQIMLGLEYSFLNRIALRGGYSFPNDEQGFSAGVGLKQPLGGMGLEVDYSYTSFGIFSDVSRLSVRFTL